MGLGQKRGRGGVNRRRRFGPGVGFGLPGHGCEDDLGGRRRGGFNHGGFSGCGLLLTAFPIVRRGKVIICK